jgi:hypothetical protein
VWGLAGSDRSTEDSGVLGRFLAEASIDRAILSIQAVRDDTLTVEHVILDENFCLSIVIRADKI